RPARTDGRSVASEGSVNVPRNEAQKSPALAESGSVPSNARNTASLGAPGAAGACAPAWGAHSSAATTAHPRAGRAQGGPKRRRPAHAWTGEPAGALTVRAEGSRPDGVRSLVPA